MEFCSRPVTLLHLCSANYWSFSIIHVWSTIYADDTKSFIAVKANQRDLHDAVRRIEDRLLEVREWMDATVTTWNSTMRKLKWFFSDNNWAKLNLLVWMCVISLLGRRMFAKNLGVLWDSQMTMADQTAKGCKTSTLHLQNIIKIRKYLLATVLKCLVHSFMTSRLDSNNALLYNILNYYLQKLQSMQNWAARVTMGGKHLSQLLEELHWLPIVKQIQFKILLLCYCCLNSNAPGQYLTSSQSRHKLSSSLHSSRAVLKLYVPCSKRLWGDSTSPVESSALRNQGCTFS